MTRLLLAAALALGLAGCGQTRAESLQGVCGPNAKIAALDDDQVVCERPDGQQFLREAQDDA